MYYKESLQLTSLHPADRELLFRVDRAIAHVYAPSKMGVLRPSEVAFETKLPQSEIERGLKYYTPLGIVEDYRPLKCHCDHVYDPQEGSCPDCGRAVSSAVQLAQTYYRVVKQPEEPAFDPTAQHPTPEVFISYKRPESAKLAADIYYRLLAEKKIVFLDKGEIPTGADPVTTFLRAASVAPIFISLVSEHYFQSDLCKMEIAHSLRCKKQFVRINVPPVPAAPVDMPWIDSPNWAPFSGNTNGLNASPGLEEFLLKITKSGNSSVSIIDLRKEACGFLLEQLSPLNLRRIWNRLAWMSDYNIDAYKSSPEIVNAILREITPTNIQGLCNALAP